MSYPSLALCTLPSLSFTMNIGKFWKTQNRSLCYLLQNHIHNFVLWHRCMSPGPKQISRKKVYHNFVLILYNFLHQVPNFVHHSFMRYRQFKFGEAGDMQPPKMQFQHKLDYNFVLILYNFVHQVRNFVHPSSFS